MSKIFIEAESFKSIGGWTVDTQSMEVIGSAYLMAHGVGVPVEDAKSTFMVEEQAEYSIYALTRDWTKQWGVKDSAGKFNLLIDGNDFDTVLGTKSIDWAWQFVGKTNLTKGEHTIALHDLTGFNGRCDAIYLTSDGDIPSNDKVQIENLRKTLNYKEIKNFERQFDLIVVGGGIAGVCTALSAIWGGADTLLINDRSVLGGCNSSEIRVCLGGKLNLPPYERLGDVVRQISPIMTTPEVFKKEYFEDHRKTAAFESIEQTCARHGKHLVKLNESLTDVEVQDGTIKSIVTTNTLTGKKTRYVAKLFSDCSGDAVLSRKSGCQTMYGRDSRDTFGESLAPLKHQKLVMGQSIRWYSEKGENQTSFPDIDWGLKFNDELCLNVYNGDWEQETGFTRDMALEAEYIRDYGLRAIYSNWSYQKNHYINKDKFKNFSLSWVSALGGKREGYRVVGDYISTQHDIENFVVLPDSTAGATWSIDMHFPEQSNKEIYGEAFRSFAYHRGIVKPYLVPYRCLYSKDIDNLFLGGRIISASHVSLSVLRVMRTLGQLGEVVGLATEICKKYDCKPRQVYTEHLDEFIQLLKRGVKVGDSFECDVGKEEAYHFKDYGWMFFDPYHEKHTKPITEKVKKCVKALEIEHKYDLPDQLK